VNQTVSVQVSGTSRVASGAAAIFGTLTVTSIDGGSGGISAWAGGASEPIVSMLRLNGDVSSSGATIAVGPTGILKLKSTGSHAVQLSLDPFWLLSGRIGKRWINFHTATSAIERRLRDN
jgi:hypothetical protein